MIRTDEAVILTIEEYKSLIADKNRIDCLEKQDCWIVVPGEYDVNTRFGCGGGYVNSVRSVCDKLLA